MAVLEVDDSAVSWQCAAFSELGAAQLYAVMALREEVFIVEQNCVYRDLDGLDQQALHLCAWEGEQLLGYSRCLPPGLDYPASAIGRIVVSPRARGRDLGRELVVRSVAINLEHWPGTGITISAQAYLERFYQSLGFESDGDVYDEDGIPHIKMHYRS